MVLYTFFATVNLTSHSVEIWACLMDLSSDTKNLPIFYLSFLMQCSYSFSVLIWYFKSERLHLIFFLITQVTQKFHPGPKFLGESIISSILQGCCQYQNFKQVTSYSSSNFNKF
jgi:hypothetical protein